MNVIEVYQKAVTQKEKESSSNPGNVLSWWIFCSSYIEIVTSSLLTNLAIICDTVKTYFAFLNGRVKYEPKEGNCFGK